VSTTTLTQRIEECNLPEMVNRYFPDADVPQSGGLVQAVWRGDRNPSFSVFRRGEVWFWKDHATGESGNCYHFLTQIVGLKPREAAKALGAESGSDVGHVRRTEWKRVEAPPAPSDAALTKLRTAQANLARSPDMPDDLRRRGITREDAMAYGIGVIGKDIVLPIYQHGEVVAVKIRKHDVSRGKYRYADKGVGSPPIHLAGKRRIVLLVEGEFNAIAAHAATGGEYHVIGMPGAGNTIPSYLLGEHKNKKWYIHADRDRAGRQAKIRWARQLSEAGVPYALMPFDTFTNSDGTAGDFCDRLRVTGKSGLREYIQSAMAWADSQRPKKLGPKGKAVAYAIESGGMDSTYRAAIDTGASRELVISAYYAIAAGDVDTAEVKRLAVGVRAVLRSNWNELLLVSAVLRGASTVQEAARLAGVATSTAYRVVRESRLFVLSSGVLRLIGNWRQIILARASEFTQAMVSHRAAWISAFVSMWLSFSMVFGSGFG